MTVINSNNSNNSKYGSMPITTSRGNCKEDGNPVVQTDTLADLFAEFSRPQLWGRLNLNDYLAADGDTQKAQKNYKYFNSATFSQGRSEKYVLNVPGLVLDIDTGNVSEEMLKDKLNDYVYIAYTSYSNSPSKVKWRALIPYNKPVPKELHYRAYNYFQNEVFSGELDSKCKQACQPWYLPSHPPGGEQYFRCFENGVTGDGSSIKLFDPTTLPEVEVKPEANPQVTNTEKSTVSTEKFDIEKVVPDGDGRHDQLNKYVWKLLYEVKPLNEVWNLLEGYNQTHCVPPHDDCELRRIFDDAVSSFEKKNPDTLKKIMDKTTRLPKKKLKTLTEIMETDYPELQWAVEGIIPEGLTIFAGAPKIGKSWFCYGLGIAISLGEKAFGSIDVGQSDVIYLALEDGDDRLKRRGRMIFDSYGYEGHECSKLHTGTEYNRFDKGGLEDLEDELQANPNIGLVVIDTLVQMQAATNKKNSYTDDYNSLLGLKKLASKFRVPIVVVHHLTKQTNEDPFNQITGTIGLQGCADSMIVLKRGRSDKEAVLALTGRDVEEKMLSFEFDVKLPGTWALKGEATAGQVTCSMHPTRQTVFNAVSTTPLGPKELWEKMGGKKQPHSRDVVRQQLGNLLTAGLLEKNAGGQYFIPQPEEVVVEEPGEKVEQPEHDTDEVEVTVDDEQQIETETEVTEEEETVEVEDEADTENEYVFETEEADETYAGSTSFLDAGNRF